MSQADVTLIQSLYAAFGRGDIATIIAAVAPDIEWRLNGSRSDQVPRDPGVHRESTHA